MNKRPAARAIATRLFDDRLVVEEIDPRDVDERSLIGNEAAMVAGAVEKRKREFAAGRLCARKGMAHLGHADVELLQGEDRAPLWPSGLVGSITHTTQWCAAVLGSAEVFAGVGVDVESASGLAENLFDRICVEEERRWLDRLPTKERAAMAKLVFSAKECAYKSQYAVTRTYLGFHAMRVEVEPSGVFTAEFRQDVGRFHEGDQIHGNFVIDDELLMTGCTIPIDAPR